MGTRSVSHARSRHPLPHYPSRRAQSLRSTRWLKRLSGRNPWNPEEQQQLDVLFPRAEMNRDVLKQILSIQSHMLHRALSLDGSVSALCSGRGQLISTMRFSAELLNQ
ncbi:unnamed protein product [Pleuronectes platessa]|uniref:Uncharacterized protein n=1 Tax=Pleuronectes platessa TaxID=8262 RepID=A0A9N7UG82_PLEPL|nr:unnamed protein product [Pleuronectes platessa]